MRICLVYDCLFPYTIGGAERWLRSVAECLAADGHEVTFLTLRQWPRGSEPGVPGVRVLTAGPRMGLYTASGRRRILPPLVFGVGVLWHLLRHGRRYDVVHTVSFPYFSLLAAAALRRLDGYRLVVDWFELWTLDYWRGYLGRWGGRIGWLIQRLCVAVRHDAFCFSQLHANRLRAEGFRGQVTVLRGVYAGPMAPRPAAAPAPVVVFAGRLIPEKAADTLPAAVEWARERLPALRAEIFGDGPESARLEQAVLDAGAAHSVRLRGFVGTEEVQEALAHALCLVLPSRREGYGLVVVEAASYGTPSVVVAGADNAAVELIKEGVNGFIASSHAPADLGGAILAIHGAGEALRESTAAWFAESAETLSVDASLETVARAYAGRADAGAREPAGPSPIARA
ncbi:MAG TPA: glycosyltransferase family 4 protein [Solirubrobacteraceae bacterium]|nr:glycosyltransferase family 4 protein [Solirubrobacteraceae bacterium]